MGSNYMMDRSWEDIKAQIVEASRSEPLTGINRLKNLEEHFIPIIERLEVTDLDKRIEKHLSMFCLTCNLKKGAKKNSPRFIIIPPGRIFNGTLDEVWVCVNQEDESGEQITVFEEKFHFSEVESIAASFYRLVLQFS